MGRGNGRRQPFRDVGEDRRICLERDHDGSGHGEGGEGQEKGFARQGLFIPLRAGGFRFDAMRLTDARVKHSLRIERTIFLLDWPAEVCGVPLATGVFCFDGHG